MSANLEMEAVAARLQSYQDQMVAVSGALEALRNLADTLISEMAGEVALLKASMASSAEVATALPVALDTIVAETSETHDSEAVETFEIAAVEPANEAIVAAAACDRLEGTEICVPRADADIAVTAVAEPVVAETPPTTTTPANVIDLAQRRKAAKPASRLRHQLTGAVASVMLIFSATAGVHGILQTELGQRLLDLGTCDADALSANRDCAFLSWMLL